MAQDTSSLPSKQDFGNSANIQSDFGISLYISSLNRSFGSQNSNTSSKFDSSTKFVHSNNAIIPVSSNSRIETRSSHGIFKPNLKYAFNTIISSEATPICFIQTKKSPNWTKVMVDEYNALIGASTWELLEQKSNLNIIECQ